MSQQSLIELAAFAWVFTGLIILIVTIAVYLDWKSRDDADGP